METIRNYLETMFSSLPHTPEVLRAKNELWQMMEDKYNELKNEGISDNEAVGTVISEFGNLDELSEDLGIHSVVTHTTPINSRKVSLEECKQYLKARASFGFKIALGVLLCIISPIGATLTDGFSSSIYEAFGACFLIICVAAAVVLFVSSPIIMHRYDFLKQEPCTIDFSTTHYINDQKERYRPTYALLLTIGIVLCILSFLPAAILDTLNLKLGRLSIDNISGTLLFIFVAIGVFMIVLTSMINSSYDTLLKLNDATTVGGNFVSTQHPEKQYISKTAATIMSVYWTTVTCIYLSISFLTFDWHLTWIIWPIASVIHAVLNSTLKK